MERFFRHIAASDQAARATSTGTLSLPFERRQKTRQRATLTSGEPVGLFLPRGTIMRGGDRLVSESGRVIAVEAAPEPVSTVSSNDAQALLRAAYHLGNRHVWVQIGSGWLRYLSDHVLDDMLRGLGLHQTTEEAPFEPEGGAYLEPHQHPEGAHDDEP